MITKMDRENRAKQFMPFSALKGYEEALKREEQILVPQTELSEDYQAELNEKLQQIQPGDKVTVEYYWNGSYIRMAGVVQKINITYRYLLINDRKINFGRLYFIADA